MNIFELIIQTLVLDWHQCIKKILKKHWMYSKQIGEILLVKELEREWVYGL